MATDKDKVGKRLNRIAGPGEALGKVLDPLFQKRGFANRSLVEHWTNIAPPPYDRVTMPDRLHWPRSKAGAEGAILYLRCREGHALAVSHDVERIAAVINRYFGYYLVQTVKLSAEPFTSHSVEEDETPVAPSPDVVRQVDMAVDEVGDEGLRNALHRLGIGILGRRRH